MVVPGDSLTQSTCRIICSPAAATPAASPRRRRAAPWVEILFFAGAALALRLAPPVGMPAFMGPLLPWTNLVFTTCTALLIAALMARCFLRDSCSAALWMGAGMLVLGTVSLLAGLKIHAGRHDAGVAMYNIAVAVAGLFQVLGAIEAFSTGRSWSQRQRRLLLAAVYSGALLLLTSAAALAGSGALPSFWNGGSTRIRDVILTAGATEHLTAAGMVLMLDRLTGGRFLHWYGRGLALLGCGLLIMLLIRDMNCSLAWLGRCAQYAGGGYLLWAVITLLRGGWQLPLERQLNEVRDRYRRTLDSIADGVVVMDRNWRCTYVSEVGAELLGVQPGQLLGRRLWDAFPSPQAEEIERFHQEAVRTLQPARFETTCPQATATGRWVECHCYPGSSGVTVWFRDVTERNRAQEEQRAVLHLLELANQAGSARELSTLVVPLLASFSGCGVVGLRLRDRDDFPFFHTRCMSHDFLASEMSLLTRGPNGHPLTGDDGQPLLACGCGRVIRGEIDRSLPCFTRGGSFWTNSVSALTAEHASMRTGQRGACIEQGWETLALVPLRLGDAPLGLLHLADMRKGVLTAEKVASLERLAQQMAVAIAKLMADDALRQTTAELKRSNEELQQFASVTSHDLQEPLRMVEAFLGLVEDRYGRQIDDQGREYIGYAVDGARRMSLLIHDLLEFSRVGSKGGSKAAVDPMVCLEQAKAACRLSLTESGAVVSADPLPSVMGDETLLTQVFQNLLSNAVKFRSDAPPVIRVTAGAETTGWWRFSMTDNGIGIDPAYRERIFAIFQRLHDRDAYPGNGVGLAICKKIIECHGGRIWVESSAGRGATFHFTLPAFTA